MSQSKTSFMNMSDSNVLQSASHSPDPSPVDPDEIHSMMMNLKGMYATSCGLHAMDNKKGGST